MPPSSSSKETRRQGDSRAQRLRLRVDAHVHVHPGFALDRFLENALRNLSCAGGPGTFEGVLLLTETCTDDVFDMLAEAARREIEFATARGWRAHRLPREDVSLRLEGPDSASLVIVAGRQIVTAEKLEVLALGTTRTFEDGRPIASVLEDLETSDTLSVIPWGFGKWMGGRGKVVERLIERTRPGLFDLGDNRARPAFFREPPHFDQGRDRGLRILAGSDPLPMRSGVSQVGTYGFECEIDFDAGRPWHSLCRALRDPSTVVQTFGRRERPLPFVRDQVAMQIVKRRRPGHSSRSAASDHGPSRPGSSK